VLRVEVLDLFGLKAIGHKLVSSKLGGRTSGEKAERPSVGRIPDARAELQKLAFWMRCSAGDGE